MAKKRGKFRAQFRKKHQGRVREGDLTRSFREKDTGRVDDAVRGERLSGKGELTRRRTVKGSESDADRADAIGIDFDSSEVLETGRVLSVHGLRSRVRTSQGDEIWCAVRQVLKSLAIDQRNVLVAGDEVEFRRVGSDGMIHKVGPRHGVISRASRGQRHVLVANVDSLLIITSASQPTIKPGLIDRMLLMAQAAELEAVVVINKVDLLDTTELQHLVGVYASMGVRILCASAETGTNVDLLSAYLRNRNTALAGQSGVGKSSLLNAVQPGLGLAVGRVSHDTDKGRHTTTAAQLLPLDQGGTVFDTPGMRQFQLWDITAAEVGGFMPDFRPYVNDCRYPDCLHIHEDDCAVKDAVADARLDARRYDAYCNLIEEELM
ncbi:MAG: ribosome small subunit-dependent GTPase A [Planctomycetota bacterium]